MEEQVHNSIINGNINRKLFQFYIYIHSNDAMVYKTHEKIREEPLWEGYLSLPVMEVGDLIYVVEIDDTVQITNRVRTTENLFKYSTSHEIELITDEKTEESRVSAEKSLEHFKMLKEKDEQLIKQPLKQPWYKRIFK